MKLLICGDSFSADWTKKYPGQGWPNMLARDVEVTNLSQAGCSEYKIRQQLLSANLHNYDAIIVSHTSPFRIYVKEHPVHKDDVLHSSSDFIYNDVKQHLETHPELSCIVGFYEKYFDLDYAITMHRFICTDIESYLTSFAGPVVHITNLNWDQYYQFPNMLSFEYLFKNHRGNMNHYDNYGNTEIYRAILSRLGITTSSAK